jgi:ribose 5-phosphate isomerase RpiB
MNIAIGSDHAGFRYKQAIIAHLRALGHEVTDFGTDSDAPVDYPALGIVDVFVTTSFEGGRHVARIRQLDE